MDKYFNFERFIDTFPKILPQLSVTFSIVLISMIIGTILAILVAVIKIQKIFILDQILGVYISFMRGTPLLVQMMIVYHGLPVLMQDLFGIDINAWSTVIFVDIAFILNEGAFLGEIFRSAILSIPSIQSEAGYSIGMTRFQTFIRIVLPQTVKIIIPAYGVDLIGVFHNTSLVFMIGGVLDIMGKAKTLGASTGHALEPYLVTAVIFIMISLIFRVIFYFTDQRIQCERG